MSILALLLPRNGFSHGRIVPDTSNCIVQGKPFISTLLQGRPMATSTRTDEILSLWNCLHDGSLESLTSDTLARSIVLVVDVPYIWSFHSLPDTSRFHLVLQGVRAAEALKFVSWPGDLVMPEGLSWKESEEIRKGFFDKGRLESIEPGRLRHAG